MKQTKNKTVESSLLTSLFEDKSSLVCQLRQIIFRAIQETVGEKVQIKPTDIKIEHPSYENYGDYSTTIALILSGRLGTKPFDIAKLLENKLSEYIRMRHSLSALTDSKRSPTDQINVSDILEKVSAVMPGFVNLTIRNDCLITLAAELLENENAVITTHLQGKKMAVEYTDPNPFKEFHLGHMYSNFIGEAIARSFEACGAKVWRGDFYGDVGMHIAKSLYGLLAKLKSHPPAGGSNLKTLKGDEYIAKLKGELDKLEKKSIKERQNFLGQGYALGVIKYDEDPKIAEEIKELNLLVYVAAQEILKKEKGWQPIINYRQYIKGKEERLVGIQPVYEAGLRWSLEYFETIYKRLGTKFDGYYPESWVGEYGMKMVEKGLTMGVLEKSEGTVVYRGEQDGLHTRVFVNKLGLPTYEAKDLGLAKAKYQDFPYDFSINVFGKEIDEYYKVVKAAMMKIEPSLGKKSFHIAHGMVKLPKGKMSSRTGTIITFEWILAEAKKQALKIMKDADLPEGEKQTVAEVVGLGAVRYALLRGSPGNDVIFDFEKSVSFEGDSGPYLQYTYARCRSVMRKAGKYTKDKKNILNTAYCIPNTEEANLLRSLYRFPEMVVEAAKTLSPNLVCSFLYDLAQKYNLFYNKHSILTPENKEHRTTNIEQVKTFRLFLTSATAQIIKKGLFILGVATVERM